MVGSASIVAMTFTLAISLGLPIGLVVALHMRRGLNATALLVGALTFVITQLVLRVPLLDLLSRFEPYQAVIAVPIVHLLILSVSAGLFEEVGRYLGFRIFLVEQWSWRDGVAFGIGHGGIEAFLLVGLTYINNLAYSLMINAGTFMESVEGQIPTEAAELIRRQLTTLPASTFAAAGVERLLTIAIHIALSLLVLNALVRRDFRYVILAIFAHAGVNLGAAGLASLDISLWYSELFLGVAAIIAIWYIFRVEPALRADSEEIFYPDAER